MLESLLKNWWILLLKGIIFILLSIYIFMNPDVAVLGLTIFIGMALLISGVFTTIAAISYRKDISNWKWYLLEGLIDTLLGIIVMAAPGLTAVLMAFFVGFWFLFYGITKVVGSFELKRNEVTNWRVELIFGILSVIFSFMIMFNPFAGAITIALLMGTFFLFTGLFNVIFAFFLKDQKKELEEVTE
jgi:uncharacterized membrane protein HdeD (DUF308 family)